MNSKVKCSWESFQIGRLFTHVTVRSQSLFQCPVEIDAPRAFDRALDHRRYMTQGCSQQPWLINSITYPKGFTSSIHYINAGQSWGLSYTVSVGDWSPLISPWTLVRDWLPLREFHLSSFCWRLKNLPLCKAFII